MTKRPSKRRVKARLWLGRIVPQRDVAFHDLHEWVERYRWHINLNRQTIQRIR